LLITTNLTSWGGLSPTTPRNTTHTRRSTANRRPPRTPPRGRRPQPHKPTKHPTRNPLFLLVVANGQVYCLEFGPFVQQPKSVCTLHQSSHVARIDCAQTCMPKSLRSPAPECTKSPASPTHIFKRALKGMSHMHRIGIACHCTVSHAWCKPDTVVQ